MAREPENPTRNYLVNQTLLLLVIVTLGVVLWQTAVFSNNLDAKEQIPSVVGNAVAYNSTLGGLTIPSIVGVVMASALIVYATNHSLKKARNKMTRLERA
ncbi:MAG: hypothetical protein V1744_07190 [Candidatus Altiarchaeota archaeon]